MEKAVVFNIMRYSVHDGPGIRTAVFLKGCPLSCKWCHNPEGLAPAPVPVFNSQKCIKCMRCGSNAYTNDCPTGAREVIGSEISSADLLNEIKKDRIFFDQSGGGVTFTGGEPFFQAEILLEMLYNCKKEYINTAIDTSGFCETETILKAADIADWFLYDIKFADSDKHKKYCGVCNDLILHNLIKLSQTKTGLLIRIPVIQQINDDIREMTAIFNIIKTIRNITAVHLLPYHDIHNHKYSKMGMPNELDNIPADVSPNMNKIMEIFSGQFRTKIGG